LYVDEIKASLTETETGLTIKSYNVYKDDSHNVQWHGSDINVCYTMIHKLCV